ncbi:hypothetical protein E4U59_006539 [Claviceps monticola]|nr:hypothetical protein E4U59_006539 [Claviceps monticola]
MLQINEGQWVLQFSKYLGHYRNGSTAWGEGYGYLTETKSSLVHFLFGTNNMAIAFHLPLFKTTSWSRCEKLRENKEKAERDLRNIENAGNSYRTPSTTDLSETHELSGLPWGSVHWGAAVTKGHEYQSRRSSGNDTYIADDPCPALQYTTYGHEPNLAPFYGRFQENFYQRSQYMYEPAGLQLYNMGPH